MSTTVDQPRLALFKCIDRYGLFHGSRFAENQAKAEQMLFADVTNERRRRLGMRVERSYEMIDPPGYQSAPLSDDYYDLAIPCTMDMETC